MPTLRVVTNVEIPPERRAELLGRASHTVAEMLGKPEAYVMVVIEDGRAMRFGASPAPAAYLELKSLGLPEAKTADYSRILCGLIGESFGIGAERIYIEFSAPPRHLFGWNGGTF